jgi:hypothetical protein
MRAFQRGKALLGALALGFVCAAGAQAQTYNITSVGWTSNPGYVIGPVDYPGLGAHGEMESRIGPSVLKGTDSSGGAVSLKTWCIDLVDTLHADTFTATDIAHSGFDATKLNEVATFLENAQPPRFSSASGKSCMRIAGLGTPRPAPSTRRACPR